MYGMHILMHSLMQSSSEKRAYNKNNQKYHSDNMSGIKYTSFFKYNKQFVFPMYGNCYISTVCTVSGYTNTSENQKLAKTGTGRECRSVPLILARFNGRQRYSLVLNK